MYELCLSLPKTQSGRSEAEEKKVGMEDMNPESVPDEKLIRETNSWYTPLTKMTPLSKYLAMALFIAMPFLGFWLGMQYAVTQNSTDLTTPNDEKIMTGDKIPVTKKTASVDKTEKINVPEGVSQPGYDKYTDEQMKFSLVYPEKYQVKEHDNGIMLSLTKYDDKRGKPVDCGGYILQPDEVVVRVSFHPTALPYMIRDDRRYENVTLGKNAMEVTRNVGGMCATTDNYLLKNHDDSYIEISVSPSETEYMQEAEKIISSVQYLGS
jgi:hypothetical protein